MTLSEYRFYLKKQMPLLGLSRLGAAVYRYLADMVDEQGYCWPSIATIALECSLSRSSVKRAIKELLAIGAVEIDPRYRENGGRSSNRYYLQAFDAEQYAAMSDSELQQRLRQYDSASADARLLRHLLGQQTSQFPPREKSAQNALF